MVGSRRDCQRKVSRTVRRARNLCARYALIVRADIVRRTLRNTHAKCDAHPPPHLTRTNTFGHARTISHTLTPSQTHTQTELSPHSRTCRAYRRAQSTAGHSLFPLHRCCFWRVAQWFRLYASVRVAAGTTCATRVRRCGFGKPRTASADCCRQRCRPFCGRSLSAVAAVDRSAGERENVHAFARLLSAQLGRAKKKHSEHLTLSV